MVLGARKKIGQILCEAEFLDTTKISRALGEQKNNSKKLGAILLEKGDITSSQLHQALMNQAGIDSVDLDNLDCDRSSLALVPIDLVSKYNLIPFQRSNSHLDVAMANPFNSRVVDELRMVTGLRIHRFYSSSGALERAILKHYGSNVARMVEDLAPNDPSAGDEGGNNGDYTPAKLHELAREPSLVNLVNLILLEAIDARASDVHIEPFEHELKIKYRIDGVLIERSPSPKRLQAAILSRIKIMANMNIAERFVPQDGHIDFEANGSKVDIRVSTVPTIFGESVTLRLLDRSRALITLQDLGMNQQLLGEFHQCLTKSHGIVLVTGPTGSGKTTTLYAALNKIYSPKFKIITIEDPVEYQLDGIIQMPVNPKRGLSFASGLRHILRQDPDIIMVGEIRDRETAEIAVRAALTGHLVLSTLHTNDAAGAITRLIDMGVEPFLLSSSLEAVLAQRLVRQICPFCKTRYEPDVNLLQNLNNSISIESETPVYHGTGCHECMNSGLRGRIGIFELLRINDALRKLIAERPTTEQILKMAPKEHACMRHDGIMKILEGVTTPEEVFRVTQELEEHDDTGSH